MLLKRQEKDNVIKALYDSTNLLASTYNPNTKELIIIFAGGGQYKYTDVSNTTYLRLESAESQGDVFHKYIKSHTTTKLEKVDVKQIIEEAAKIKGLEDDALELGRRSKIIKSLETLLAVNDEVPFEKNVFKTELLILQGHTDEYLKI